MATLKRRHQAVAVVGIAGRFPGANNLNEFWSNLRQAVSSTRSYSKARVASVGYPYAMASPCEYDEVANALDLSDEVGVAHQSMALECARAAVESAGYSPHSLGNRMGVYVGIGADTYMSLDGSVHGRSMKSIQRFRARRAANDNDFLASSLPFALVQGGPAQWVHTVDSGGLGALKLGCQSLLDHQTDLVLAGGVSVSLTEQLRWRSKGKALIGFKPCPLADYSHQSVTSGHAVGLVLLKRLADALVDGDHIHAVIKGVAINHARPKARGYGESAVNSQVDVVLQAQEAARVNPDSIRYVEVHGSGTYWGDSLEVAALTRAFRTRTRRRQYCAIGSVKTHTGHVDTAVGMFGLIKTILAVEYGEIPPSLNFKQANPQLHVENTPFLINSSLRKWPAHEGPRRAGVSSFGIGGSNVHVIVEEAPVRSTVGLGCELQLSQRLALPHVAKMECQPYGHWYFAQQRIAMTSNLT